MAARLVDVQTRDLREGLILEARGSPWVQFDGPEVTPLSACSPVGQMFATGFTRAKTTRPSPGRLPNDQGYYKLVLDWLD